MTFHDKFAGRKEWVLAAFAAAGYQMPGDGFYGKKNSYYEQVKLSPESCWWDKGADSIILALRNGQDRFGVIRKGERELMTTLAEFIAPVETQTVSTNDDDRTQCVGFGYRDDDSKAEQRRSNRAMNARHYEAMQAAWESDRSSCPFPRYTQDGCIEIIRMIAEAAGIEKLED